MLKIFNMEKNIELLIDLAKKRLKNPVSKEEALNSFMSAGILNSEGQFTENYPHLSEMELKNNKYKNFRIIEIDGEFEIERLQITYSRILWWKKEIQTWKKIDKKGNFIYRFYSYGFLLTNESKKNKKYSSLEKAKKGLSKILELKDLKPIYHYI